MKPPFVRSPYNYDLDKASQEAAYVETMPSLTVQSMTEDADLNILMKRFGVTGKLPDNPRVPQYGDFTGVTDYQSALDAIHHAQVGFMEFPADVRARFDNDPQRLLEFVSTPGNADEGARLGLWKTPGEAPAISVPPSVVPATPVASGAPPVLGAPGKP